MRTLVISLLLLLPPVPFAYAQDISFAEADALYQAGECARAAESYHRIVEATDNPDVRLRGLLRLGDCEFRGGPFGDRDGGGDTYPDAFYAQVLDHGYSPYLAEAYHKWRTATQVLRHGVSNFSEIPTRKYRARKQRVLKVIAAHLRSHPDDPTALAQQAALRQLPDIQRGRPYGSSVLTEMGSLWPEILREANLAE